MCLCKTRIIPTLGTIVAHQVAAVFVAACIPVLVLGRAAVGNKYALSFPSPCVLLLFHPSFLCVSLLYMYAFCVYGARVHRT